MSYIKALETDQITLPSDSAYWVRLKKRATYGDQLAAQSVMFKLDGPSGTITSGEWAAYIRALTLSMIVEWNLDEDGTILPITADSLNRLSPEDGEFIASQVAERAKTRAVEQERPFASLPSNS